MNGNASSAIRNMAFGAVLITASARRRHLLLKSGWRIGVPGMLLLALAAVPPEAAYANTPSGVAEVVRVQGTLGHATGSLIGMQNNGNQVAMTFLTADHLIQQFGTLDTIGFGNLSTPILNLNTTATQNVQIFTKGPDGTEDLAVIGITIDRSNLTPSQQSFLSSLTPLGLTAAPTPFSPFEITTYGFGLSGSVTDYGTQQTFNNMIDRYHMLTAGSYTTDQLGNPLVYTQRMEGWTYNDPNTGDWIPGEGAGYAGYSGSPLTISQGGEALIQGIQVHGSGTANLATSDGVRFTAAYANWIQNESQTYLATVPVPPAAWLFGSGLLGLIGVARRKRANTDHETAD